MEEVEQIDTLCTWPPWGVQQSPEKIVVKSVQKKIITQKQRDEIYYKISGY